MCGMKESNRVVAKEGWRWHLLASFLLVPIIAIGATLYLTLRKDPFFLDREFDAQTIATLSVKKTIVVTGANAGLGYSSVKHLFNAGTAKVIIMGCRSEQKCEDARLSLLQQADEDSAAKADMLRTAKIDLSSIASVRQFASDVQSILHEYKDNDDDDDDDDDDDNDDEESESEATAAPLDILMNNAGIMGPPYSLAEDTGVEIQMHVNHLGHFALTSLLHPNLQTGDGRIVNVSSMASALGSGYDVNDFNFVRREWMRKKLKEFIPSFMAYGASKRANLIFTHGLNTRFGHDGIRAVAAHPGGSRTEISLNGWHFAPLFLRQYFAFHNQFLMPSDYGALSQVRAALDVDNVLPDAYVGPLFLLSGRPVVVGTSMKSLHHLLWPVKSETDVDELWKFSEEAIGWKFQ